MQKLSLTVLLALLAGTPEFVAASQDRAPDLAKNLCAELKQIEACYGRDAASALFTLLHLTEPGSKNSTIVTAKAQTMSPFIAEFFELAAQCSDRPSCAPLHAALNRSSCRDYLTNGFDRTSTYVSTDADQTTAETISHKILDLYEAGSFVKDLLENPKNAAILALAGAAEKANNITAAQKVIDSGAKDFRKVLTIVLDGKTLNPSEQKSYVRSISTAGSELQACIAKGPGLLERATGLVLSTVNGAYYMFCAAKFAGHAKDLLHLIEYVKPNSHAKIKNVYAIHVQSFGKWFVRRAAYETARADCTASGGFIPSQTQIWDYLKNDQDNARKYLINGKLSEVRYSPTIGYSSPGPFWTSTPGQSPGYMKFYDTAEPTGSYSHHRSKSTVYVLCATKEEELLVIP